MKTITFIALLLLAAVIASIISINLQIHYFMPVLKTCEDDFAIIDKCGCVPCSWQDAGVYNGINCSDMINSSKVQYG